MTMETILLIGGALGLGTIVPYIVKTLVDWRKGRIGREAAALKLADEYLARARTAEERYWRLRMIAIRRGIDFEDMPPPTAPSADN